MPGVEVWNIQFKHEPRGSRVALCSFGALAFEIRNWVVPVSWLYIYSRPQFEMFKEEGRGHPPFLPVGVDDDGPIRREGLEGN